MTTPHKPWAVIVGAGPSGLLLALMLAKRNISVTVLEGSDVLDDSPRAAYYGPPAAYELGRAGVLDEIRAQGFDPLVTCWRKLDGTYLAGWDCTVVKDDADRLACMPLATLDKLLYRHATAQPGVQVLFNHKVVDIGQDDNKAWVDAQTPDGVKRFEAEYVVGCDGASSTVRKKMFANEKESFPGWTWDEQIVATNVRSLLCTLHFDICSPGLGPLSVREIWLCRRKLLH
jgi:2-polyprenyl-6-methoxyphenol hydroxylase-like FAD-dependent oxidoreductase